MKTASMRHSIIATRLRLHFPIRDSCRMLRTVERSWTLTASTKSDLLIQLFTSSSTVIIPHARRKLNSSQSRTRCHRRSSCSIRETLRDRFSIRGESATYDRPRRTVTEIPETILPLVRSSGRDASFHSIRRTAGRSARHELQHAENSKGERRYSLILVAGSTRKENPISHTRKPPKNGPDERPWRISPDGNFNKGFTSLQRKRRRSGSSTSGIAARALRPARHPRIATAHPEVASRY